jgi:endonuclease YncB( thermonuclease family)
MSSVTGGSSAAASLAAFINEWRVPQGLASRQHSCDYVAAEDEARGARRGMWAGAFDPPWEWRHRR